MTLKQIKSAVKSGRRVYWSNEAYEVIHDDIGQWLIRCTFNGSCIGLMWQDEVTMNGKPEEFYLGDKDTRRNARFWVYWHDGWVKLTLKPEQSLEVGYGRLHDEGWCRYHQSWEHDGDRVLCASTSESADCDGRHSDYDDCECLLENLAAVQHEKLCDFSDEYPEGFMPDFDAPLTPKWEHIKASQYDQFAEAAGY